MVEKELTDLRKQWIVYLFSCVDNAAKFLNGEEKENEFSKLRACIEECCVLEARRDVAAQALEKAKAEMDPTNLESLQERFDFHLSSMAKGREDLTHHPHMLELNKRIQKANQADSQSLDESVDLAITETQEKFIDPITKKQIQDPVKNTVCGHVYDRETIMELIGARKNVKCPVIGCGNGMPLSARRMASDDELRHRLELMRQRQLAHVSDRSIHDLDLSV